MSLNLARHFALFLVPVALAACSDLSEDELPAPVQPATDAGPVADAAEDIVKNDAAPPDDGLEIMCDGITDKVAAVVFTAPDPRGGGYLAFSAKVDYPDMANKPDIIPGLNPFPGCVAPFATDQSLACNFGAAFQGTSVTFNVGLSDGSVAGVVSHYFSQSDGTTVATLGMVGACVGTRLVGLCKSGKCAGALSQDVASGNLMYMVPQV